MDSHLCSYIENASSINPILVVDDSTFSSNAEKFVAKVRSLLTAARKGSVLGNFQLIIGQESSSKLKGLYLEQSLCLNRLLPIKAFHLSKTSQQLYHHREIAQRTRKIKQTF